jgi:hypothetical protein
MPQLDFFTIYTQIFCLFFSIFIIYIFLLKYALPTYDVFLRLRIKKLILYKIQLNILSILSLTYKERVLKYINIISNLLFDFYKLYFNFLITILPLSYSLSLVCYIKKNSKIVIKNSRKVPEVEDFISNYIFDSRKKNNNLKKYYKRFDPIFNALSFSIREVNNKNLNLYIESNNSSK